MVKWMAVLYGIIASIIIGLISGLGLPFTSATLPVIGAGVSGLIAGGVAGYFAHESLGSGALHGLLATTIGALIVAGFLLVVGTLAAGLIGFSAGIAVLLLVVSTGIPGAVGGAIGAVLAPDDVAAGQPTR